jgi:hypothetical protein
MTPAQQSKRAPYLRIVAPPQHPPRLEVRISAASRGAFGRSRVLRLRHGDLDELIAVALRSEARR